MTLQGHVQNGVVILDQPVALPEGARVRVELIEGEPAASAKKQEPTLYDRLKPVIGVIDDLPADMAENHDYYIHGTPKK